MAVYTIHALATLSGVSSRTLRHYEAIGLLKPLKKNAAGYRIYGSQEVDRLQQILLYKTTGMKLEEIRQLLATPGFDAVEALRKQKQLLLRQQKAIEGIIQTMDHTIQLHTGEIKMTDTQKFTHLKQHILEENDKQYGQEVKERWGEEARQRANQQFKNLTPEQYEKAQNLETEFKTTLRAAFTAGNPKSEMARKAVELHKQWLTLFWPAYSLEAHRGLTQMYVDDKRFHHYFNDNKELAEFFREAVFALKEE